MGANQQMQSVEISGSGRHPGYHALAREGVIES